MAAHRMVSRSVGTALRTGRRGLHTTPSLAAISPLRMPALSPTMESGTINAWKLTPGTSFSAGDILCTIETDKAEVDVEAQDDGVMGEQLIEAGKSNVPVGEVIAVLGEDKVEVEGAKIPEEWKTTGNKESVEKGEDKIKGKGTTEGSSPQVSEGTKQAAVHGPLKSSLPLSPAVMRLLTESGTHDSTSIKGTGFKGRLTKGDVLAFLGKVKSPQGTAEKLYQPKSGEAPAAAPPKKELPPPDAATFRRMIAAGLGLPAPAFSTPSLSPSFDDILAGYTLAPAPKSVSSAPLIPGVKKDSFAEILGL